MEFCDAAFGIVVVCICMLLCGLASGQGNKVSDYDVQWDTPSKNSSGSMPLGNGDVGINLWVEENGDLVFYISKTDAWSENARLLKLGRVRVKLTPSPFAQGVSFSQRLHLREGMIHVDIGEPPGLTVLGVLVHALNPYVSITIVGRQPMELTVSLEIWRDTERLLVGDERFSAYGLQSSPQPVTVSPDTVLSGQRDRIVWFHRNESSIWPLTLSLQGMGEWADQARDPLLHRTFGGVIEGKAHIIHGPDDIEYGPALISNAPGVLKSREPSKGFMVSVYAHTEQTDTTEQWIANIEQVIADIEAMDSGQRLKAHVDWWQAFWDRSWIYVSGTEDAEVVSRGYALQRFISACAGRGAYPIKFNGSIFTVDSRESGKNFDADYRNWGGPYWFQNTRLVYWPMLASGDFDMMQPLFRMFLDGLPFARARTKAYFGHGGSFFPETMYFWGAYANDNYGWDREGKHISHVDNTYIRHYFSGALELLAMMVDYHAFTQDAEWARSHLLPFADTILAFYDEHYSRDEQGKILFKPAQALETWQQAVNPLPPIAGLRVVLDGLLDLPLDPANKEQRMLWQRLRGELPPLPMSEVEEGAVLAPAQETLADVANSENPELYAVFPYRLYGVGKPDLEIARQTFEQRRVKGHNGWRQDDTQAAFLGLTATAREYLSKRFAMKHPGSRFPAFWGPNFDWIPDQDHGGNGLMALQTMLMQTDGRKILLFPAWPREWDVDFKLHAPFNTVVEGTYRDGELKRLEVSPPERKQDVTVMGPADD